MGILDPLGLRRRLENGLKGLKGKSRLLGLREEGGEYGFFIPDRKMSNNLNSKLLERRVWEPKLLR